MLQLIKKCVSIVSFLYLSHTFSEGVISCVLDSNQNTKNEDAGKLFSGTGLIFSPFCF
jgi:hypothetical protein